MLPKVLLLFVILGIASSDPIQRSITNTNDIITSLITDYTEQLELSIRPETIRSLGNFVNSAIGLKLSALAITVKILKWLKSNVIGIAIGSIIAIGICKITGKCHLNNDYGISKLFSLVTSERLEMAQNLLVSALRRFGQEDEDMEEGEENEEDEE